jgi:hypothetical protein
MTRRLMVLTMAALAACSDGPSTPPEDDSNQPLLAGDLQPLEVGRTWTYIGMLGERQVHTITGRDGVGRLDCVVYQIEAGSTIQRLWMRAEKDGVKHYRTQLGELGPVELDDAAVHYVLPATPGRTWQYEEMGVLPVTYDGTIVGVESVEVPAGRFRCVKVRIVGTHEKVRMVERTSWYAPGVGLVKEEALLNKGDGVERGSIALKEYKK